MSSNYITKNFEVQMSETLVSHVQSHLLSYEGSRVIRVTKKVEPILNYSPKKWCPSCFVLHNIIIGIKFNIDMVVISKLELR